MVVPDGLTAPLCFGSRPRGRGDGHAVTENRLGSFASRMGAR
jgi:hypothetical protein